MIFKFIGAACAVLLLPALAAGQEAGPLAVATPDPMAAAYDNTITIEIPGLYSARQYIDPDHSWRLVSSDGNTRGTWSVAGGRVCLAQTAPPGPTLCHPAEAHAVGDSWLNIDPASGQTVIIGLVAGRPK
jgi:hypothetical protein